jgi:hypothetical protein
MRKRACADRALSLPNWNLGELGAIFKRWYLDMDLEVEEMPAAA